LVLLNYQKIKITITKSLISNIEIVHGEEKDKIF